MKRIERLRLDINKEDSFNIVNFKQNDTCDLIIDIYKDGIVQDVSNQIINFYVKKPDNTFVEQTTGISATGNVVTINVDEQVVTREGRAYGEITLRDDNGKMTSSCFIINVGEQKVNINDLIESSDKIAILDEIRDFIEQSRRDIEEYKATIRDLDERVAENDAKINGLNEKIEEIDINIDEVKENALTEMDNKHREVIEAITSADEALREAKEQALTDINAEKDNALNTVEEKQTEAVEAIESTKNESVEEINVIKTELQDLNRVAQNTKVQLKAEHTTAENRREALQEVVDSANAINELLITTTEEANNKKIDLDEIINRVNSLITMSDNVIQSLTTENAQAEANINELNPLNIEADENIEELKALIKEAKEIAIPALKAYIAEFAPAEDLTEVNQQLEELYNAVNELNIRFNNYYTKNEVKDLLKDKVGVVEDEAIQTIFTDIPDFITSPPPKINFEPVNTLFYSRLANQQHILCYFKKEIKNNIVLDANNYIYFNNLADNDVVIYYWDTRYSEGWKGSDRISNVTGNGSSSYRITNFYYHDFDIYSKNDTTKIVRKNIEHDASNDVNDFNNATTLGKYKVSQTANVLNSPIEGTFKGMLIVDKIDAVDAIISQELIIEGNTSYKRLFINNAWTEWKEGGGASDIDLSDFITSDDLNEAIQNASVDLSNYYNKAEINELLKDKTGLIGELIIPDFYKTAPASPFNDETHVVLRFKGNDGYNYIGYAKNNEGYPAYMKKSGTTERLYGGIDTNNCKFYKYNGSSWSFLNNNSIVMNSNTSLSDIYTNNVDIIYHNDSDEQYRGNIWKKGTDDNVVAINDYNNAVKYEKYTINQTESEIFNSPVNGVFNGILINDIVDNVIHQTVISNNNEVKYSRCRVNSEWTVWKDEGQVDLSDYYNKNEIDAKLAKEIGIIKSGDPNFKEPVWDVLPTNTFINIPVNPDPSVYKWEMKCSHYGYHMVFYFPIDPTGKFGIVQRADGKLGFKLLDNSFKYKEYTSYYKEKDSSTRWSAMPSDNHFLYPDKRILEAIYSHNFDIVDGNNPDVVFRYGSQNDFGAEFIKDFNEATELEVYTVDATGEGVIENSPIVGAYKGVLKVFNVNGMVHQTLETTKGESCKRLCVGGEWTEWSRESQFEINPEQYSERNGNYTTNSLIELYNNNLRFEYGEYEVDSAKNSQHVENPTKEYTDLIMLKAGGFKQVLGCMVFPHKLDFHYSIYCNINMVLVDPSNKPDCMRLYIGYLGDRNEAFHPINGLGKVKYCVFGY